MTISQKMKIMVNNLQETLASQVVMFKDKTLRGHTIARNSTKTCTEKTPNSLNMARNNSRTYRERIQDVLSKVNNKRNCKSRIRTDPTTTRFLVKAG